MASAVIINTDNHQVKNIKSINYAISNISYLDRTTIINSVLPFRVKFTTIGIAPAYANVPGIGLQIIGVNNYIL